jgi:hypothetical protein
VDVREGQLLYDKETRRLVYADGNRRETQVNAAMVWVLSYIRDKPGQSGRAIEDAAKADGANRNEVREARKAAVVKGFVATAAGEKRAELHQLTAAGFAYLRELTTGGAPAEDDEWPAETHCACGGWISPSAAASGATQCLPCLRVA